MDLLKRELAPIVSQAWAEIDRRAQQVLKLNLAARKLVDLDGPHGWTHAAINLGRVVDLPSAPASGVNGALRAVQQLVELRPGHEGATIVAVEERPLSTRVAGEDQPLVAGIPDYHREVA